MGSGLVSRAKENIGRSHCSQNTASHKSPLHLLDRLSLLFSISRHGYPSFDERFSIRCAVVLAEKTLLTHLRWTGRASPVLVETPPHPSPPQLIPQRAARDDVYMASTSDAGQRLECKCCWDNERRRGIRKGLWLAGI